MTRIVRSVFNFLADRWCYYMHPDPMWPVNGYYRCPLCFRTHPVAWANATSGQLRVSNAPIHRGVAITPVHATR